MKKPVLNKLRINVGAARKEVFQGREHTVFPAVAAVAGVLNGAKLTAEELGRFVDAWNGRPIPLLHPEMRGEPVSANSPDILQRAVGTVFNAVMDGDALKVEFWIDNEKMDRLGESKLLADMVEGKKMIDVSTAYFSDTVIDVGEFKGKPHEVAHRNLRPDHIALLPDEDGACSIEDGCGVPRINKRSTKVKEVIEALMRGLGLKVNNCQCGGDSMDILAIANKLKANGKLTGEQYESLTKMDEEQRGMVGAILSALTEADKAAAKAAAKKAKTNEEGEEEEEEGKPASNKQPKANAGKGVTVEQLAETITNKVLEKVTVNMDRRDVKAKLLANSANAFSEEEIDTMPVEALKKYERSIRPADYSGQGGFASNSGGKDDAPLMLNHGVLLASKNEAKQ